MSVWPEPLDREHIVMGVRGEGDTALVPVNLWIRILSELERLQEIEAAAVNAVYTHDGPVTRQEQALIDLLARGEPGGT